MDFDKFLELLKALARERVDYVLVGAVALSLHGIVRTTEDVDLFIRPESENVERALWVGADDPRLANRIRRLWRFSSRLAGPSAERGVRRFHSIEEANAERERRIHRRVKALLAERAAPRSG